VKTSPPFVGRREELAWLEDILQGVHAGQPRVVLLLGEAGIGKTRLLRVTRIILTPGIREDLPINPTGEDEDIWVIRAKHKPLNEVEIVAGQDIYVSQQVVENVVETVRLRQTK
jgi:hypothetical protein